MMTHNSMKDKFDDYKKLDFEKFLKMIGDLRQEYQPNKDDCTNCIGQITAHFDASDKRDRDVVGTGTIYFKLTKTKYLIVTAAHNLV